MVADLLLAFVFCLQGPALAPPQKDVDDDGVINSDEYFFVEILVREGVIDGRGSCGCLLNSSSDVCVVLELESECTSKSMMCGVWGSVSLRSWIFKLTMAFFF